MEVVTNTEDRLVRVESVVMGLTDALNELAQQMHESQTVLQEAAQTVLDGTPKLPKRVSTTGPQPRRHRLQMSRHRSRWHPRHGQVFPCMRGLRKRVLFQP